MPVFVYVLSAYVMLEKSVKNRMASDYGKIL